MKKRKCSSEAYSSFLTMFYNTEIFKRSMKCFHFSAKSNINVPALKVN